MSAMSQQDWALALAIVAMVLSLLSLALALAQRRRYRRAPGTAPKLSTATRSSDAKRR